MDQNSIVGELDSRRELTKTIIHLAIPIIIGALVQTSYHLINAFWVGRLGADAVAVISVCLPINMLLISLGSGLALACSIFVAQYFGAGQRQSINHVVAQSLMAIVGLSLCIALAGYWLAPQIAKVYQMNAVLTDQVATYLRVSFVAQIFLMLSSFYQAVLRGLGEAKAPLRIILCSVVINALLDPLLIFGLGPVPALGVIGAAWATSLTQLITAALGIRLMLKPAFGIHLGRQVFRPDKAVLGHLFRLGIPASVEQSAQALSVSVMTLLVAPFGTTTLAAFGIVFRITTLSIIPSFGLSIATSILVGQALGAGSEHRALRLTRLSALIGCSFMTFMSLLLLVFATPVVRFFVPDDPALIETGTLVLRVFALSFPLTAIQLVLSGAFRGAGATLASMVLALVGTWMIQLPLTWLLSRERWLGEPGLWWASLLAAVISLSIAVVYYRQRRWLGQNIGH